MGTGSSNASAYTYIETEVSSFLPGASVTGNVKILAEKPIQANQMIILLHCLSQVRWSTGSGKHRRTHYDKRVLFTIQFPIWNFQGQLPQGQFTLPFSIQLPANIPPSFSFRGKYRGFGKNEYTFEAIIEGTNEVQAQQTVVWVSRLPKPNEAIVPVSSEANIKVTTCCCFKQGTVQLRSTASRNVTMATEELTVTSKITNTLNKYTVNLITCSLIRHVRLKVIPRSDSAFFSIAGSAIVIPEEDVRISQHLEIKPGQSDTSEVVMSLNLNQNSNLWTMPAITSDMVDCQYFVKVTLGFNNFCGCGTYSVMLPIEVCNGMVAINTTFSPPPQINVPWNPSMLSSAPVAAQGYTNLPYQGSGYPPQDMTMIGPNTAGGDIQNGNTIVPKA